MTDKSKLFSAKLKISKLREKYSKSINTTPIENKLMSPSFNLNRDHNETNVNVVKQDLGLKENLSSGVENKHTDNKLMGQLKEDEGLKQFDNSNVQICNMLTEQLCDKLSTTTSISLRSSTSKISSDNVLSGTSNQLQHLFFVSSSSDDHSLIQEADGNNIIKLKSPICAAKLPESGNILAQKSIKENLAIRHELHKKIVEHNDNTSVKSTIHSEFSVKVASIEEKTDKEYTSTKYDSSSYDSDTGSDKISSIFDNVPTNSGRNLESNVKHHDLKSNSVSCTDENTVMKTPTRHKLKKQESTKLFLKDIFGNHNFIGNKSNHVKDRPELTLTNSRLTNVNQMNNGQKAKCGKRNIENKLIAFYKTHKNPAELLENTHHHSLQHNVNKKRPTLKSCKLIRNKEDFQAYTQKTTIFPSHNTIQGICEENVTGHSCDEVIRQLLKAQIQLTRHFIESHHQMYLDCCLAVQMLSDQYVCNNELPFQ